MTSSWGDVIISMTMLLLVTRWMLMMMVLILFFFCYAKKQTVWQMCEGDDKVWVASCEGWTPAVHKHFPKDMKESIRTLLLCLQKLHVHIPRDVVHLICKNVVRVYYST